MMDYMAICKEIAAEKDYKSFHVRPEIISLPAGKQHVLETVNFFVLVAPVPPFTGEGIRVQSEGGIYQPNSAETLNHALLHTGKIVFSNQSGEQQKLMVLKVYDHDPIIYN